MLQSNPPFIICTLYTVLTMSLYHLDFIVVSVVHYFDRLNRFHIQILNIEN